MRLKKMKERRDMELAEEIGITVHHGKKVSTGSEGSDVGPSFENGDVEWIKDITSTIQSPSYPNSQQFQIRICIHPLPQPPALQRYKITVKAPTEDAFFHWTSFCNQFSFRTLVKRHGWRFDGDGIGEAFEGFGELVKDRVREILVDPKRYLADIQIFSPGSAMALTFREIVNNYRKVELLTLEFVPSAWDEVITDIRLDYERTQVHYSLLKTSLIQSLNIVTKRHPVILLSGGIPDPMQVTQPKPWKELMSDLMPGVTEEGGEELTDEERMLRKKIFVLLTLGREEVVEVSYVKSIPVTVEGYPNPYDTTTERLTFTIFSKGSKSSAPTSYLLSLTSPTDLFLNFISPEITPAFFTKLTHHLNLLHATHSPLSRLDVLGFHPSEGLAGGVIGILGKDFVEGCGREKERYGVVFSVEESGGGMDTGKPPPLRKGRLVFCETVLYRTRELVRLEFLECKREQLKAEVQDRYSRLKREIDWTQYRLDALLDTIRRKAPSLLSELSTIPIPRSYTSTKKKRPQSQPTIPILEPVTEEKPKQAFRRIRQDPLIVPTNTVRPRSPSRLSYFDDNDDGDDETIFVLGDRSEERNGGTGGRDGWSPSRIPIYPATGDPLDDLAAFSPRAGRPTSPSRKSVNKGGRASPFRKKPLEADQAPNVKRIAPRRPLSPAKVAMATGKTKPKHAQA
ncbi:hypothetical protein HDU67_008336 [Dinochytrium kinnereticum]|nr:hypothetical protein HDU67_008336 [Dinochytrium kinnereticum]